MSSPYFKCVQLQATITAACCQRNREMASRKKGPGSTHAHYLTTCKGCTRWAEEQVANEVDPAVLEVPAVTGKQWVRRWGPEQSRRED